MSQLKSHTPKAGNNSTQKYDKLIFTPKAGVTADISAAMRHA